MMKPMLGLSLHVSMPTYIQVLGVCADAGAAKISAASTAIRIAFITIDLLIILARVLARFAVQVL